MCRLSAFPFQMVFRCPLAALARVSAAPHLLVMSLCAYSQHAYAFVLVLSSFIFLPIKPVFLLTNLAYLGNKKIAKLFNWYHFLEEIIREVKKVKISFLYQT